MYQAGEQEIEKVWKNTRTYKTTDTEIAILRDVFDGLIKSGYNIASGSWIVRGVMFNIWPWTRKTRGKRWRQYARELNGGWERDASYLNMRKGILLSA